MAMIPPKRASVGNFELCPAGPQQLVCCDVVDHGMVSSMYSGKPRTQWKISLRWQSSHRMRSGKPYLIQKRYTFSLHEKSSLRKDLNAWRGVPLTDDEAVVFDLERLLGRCAFGNVAHLKKPRGVFAEVVSLMPVPKGMPRIAVESYIRVIERKPGEVHDDHEQGEAYEGPDTEHADTSFDPPAPDAPEF